MHVQDLMTPHVRYCGPRETLREAMRAMRQYSIGCLPVVDDAKRLVGILTDRDVALAAYRIRLPIEQIVVAQAMTRDVVTCSPQDPLRDAESRMRNACITRTPVLDADGGLVGLLSLTDIVRHRAGSLLERGATPSSNDLLDTMAAASSRRHHAR